MKNLADMSRNTRVKVNTNLMSCKLDDDAVVLQLKTGVYFGMQEVAARVWDLLCEPRTLEEICSIVTSEYDVDPDACERDLLIFLNELASQSLVETTSQ